MGREGAVLSAPSIGGHKNHETDQKAGVSAAGSSAGHDPAGGLRRPGRQCGTAVTEQSILKHINKARAAADVGLSPVKNDPTLANAAAKLLEAFSKKEKGSYRYGVGYKLTGKEVKGHPEECYRRRPAVRDYRASYSEDGAFFALPPLNSRSDGG